MPHRQQPPTGEPTRFLTAAEVADKLRVTPITIVRLCRAGKLPATKPAGTWLISETDLQQHIDNSRPTSSERGDDAA